MKCRVLYILGNSSGWMRTATLCIPWICIWNLLVVPLPVIQLLNNPIANVVLTADVLDRHALALFNWGIVDTDVFVVAGSQSGDSSELASRLPCKGKSVRNRGVSQTMPFLVIPRSLLRGGFIHGRRLEGLLNGLPQVSHLNQRCPRTDRPDGWNRQVAHRALVSIMIRGESQDNQARTQTLLQ